MARARRRPRWRPGAPASGSANPDVTVNYDPAGSSSGREQFLSGGLAFAGSDAALDDDELKAGKDRCPGGDAIDLPLYVSPVAVIYNLEGVEELTLSPEVIADIFNQKISKWNDPAITALNEGVEPAGPRHHAGEPLRRLRHDRELHRLPRRGGRRRVAVRGRQRVPGEGRRGGQRHLRPGRGRRGRQRHHRLRRPEPGRRARRRQDPGRRASASRPSAEAASALVDLGAPAQRAAARGDITVELPRTPTTPCGLPDRPHHATRSSAPATRTPRRATW